MSIALPVALGAERYDLRDYYHPMVAGNQWVYDSQQGSSTWTTTCRILKASVPLNCYSNCAPVVPYTRSAASVVFDQGGGNSWTNFMHVAASGFGYVGFDHVDGTRLRFGPEFIYTNRFALGQMVSVADEVYSGGVCSGQGSQSIRLLGLADVTVPYGSFTDCLHLEITSSIGGSTTVDESWWAKGMGPVKWTHGGGGDFETNELRAVSFAETVRLVDYYPLPLNGHWLYQGLDWDGFPAKSVRRVDATSTLLTLYTGRNPATSYTTNVISEYNSYVDSTTLVPYDEWTSYMAAGSSFGHFGDSGAGDIRLDRGVILPEFMAVGDSITNVVDAYIAGTFVGTVSFIFQVLEQTALTVPAGTFPEVLRVRIATVTPGDAGAHDEWWAKSVGSIKEVGVSGDGMIEQWELIEYSVPLPPAIETQPEDRTNSIGTAATFQVGAVGAEPLTYQWRFNGMNLSNGGRVAGATSSTLTLSGVQASDAGGYAVVVSNAYGSVTSSIATLKLPPGPLSAQTITDNFTDPTQWGTPFAAPDMAISVGSGTMNYTSTSTSRGGAAIPRIAPLLPTTQNWSLKVDAHIDPLPLTTQGQFTDVFLGFGKTGDWFNTFVTFEFNRGWWSGSFGYSIGDDVRINGVDAPGLFNVNNLTSPDVALRMDYNAASHTVTYYFDSNGAAGGYNWVAQGAASLAGGTYNLNLNAADTFTIFLLGSSEFTTVAAGEAYLSNLEITVSPAPMNWGWAKRIASTTSPNDELSIGMTLDSQGNCYVTGWFDGTNDFGGLVKTSVGGQDIFAAKYDRNGVLQWAERAGSSLVSSSPYWDQGRGIGVDTNGNVYVTGGFHGSADFGAFSVSTAQNMAFFLAKCNSLGTVQWVRQSVGGSSDGVYGTGLAVDDVGNSYAVGFADNGTTVSFGTVNLLNPNARGYSTFLVKYDNAGTVKWAQLMGGPDHTYATKVAVDASGNVYVHGGFSMNMTIGATNLVSVGGDDMFLAKFDNAGALIWVQQEGGAGDEGGDGGVAVDPDGNVYDTGAFGSSPMNFGSTSLTNAGSWDAFIAKYNSSGLLQWTRRAGGTNLDAYLDVALDGLGNVYAAGALGSDAVAPNGTGGAMVAKYDPAGTLQWAYSASGPPADPVGSMVAKCAVDSAGNCYLAGWYQGTVTFGTNVLQPQGYWNYFLARLSPGSDSLQFGSLTLSDGAMQVRLDGMPGQSVIVDTSYDLTTWTPWQTNTLPVGGLDLAVPIGTSDQFFRGRVRDSGDN